MRVYADHDGQLRFIQSDGTDAAIGGGGGGSGLSVLGPFTVNWDDTPDATSGESVLYRLASLGTGTVVIRCWVFVKINVTGSGGLLTAVNGGITRDADLFANLWGLNDYNGQNGADYTGDQVGTEQPPGDSTLGPVAGWVTADDGALVVTFLPTETLTQGQVEVGALVWTP